MKPTALQAKGATAPFTRPCRVGLDPAPNFRLRACGRSCESGLAVIDLDAIKAAGLNSDAVSRQMLASHEYRARIELLAEMVSRYCETHPQATVADVEQYRQRAAIEAGV